MKKFVTMIIVVVSIMAIMTNCYADTVMEYRLPIQYSNTVVAFDDVYENQDYTAYKVYIDDFDYEGHLFAVFYTEFDNGTKNGCIYGSAGSTEYDITTEEGFKGFLTAIENICSLMDLPKIELY